MVLKSGKVISTITSILFLTSCIAATVNTGLFVYPSLSRSLLMEGGLLLLALVAFLHWPFAGRTFPLHSSIFTKFIVVWMVYIVVHGRLSEVMELYRTVYLCVTLLSVISLSYCLRAGLLSSEGIYGGLLIIAVIHVFCVFAQWMGFMEPENSLYPITGACDNPNVTAMYLVGVLPVLLSVTRMRAVARLLFLFLILLAIVLLRCRTAYIGLAVEVVVMLFAYGKARRLVFSHRWVVVVIGVLVCAFSAVKLYNMKRDSADGRLLIWKVSAMMVAERPLGCGYGLFPKHYNLRQAEYFHEEHGTETERRNASFVYMAYDDFLEHGVEGGIIGMLFLMGFYTIFTKRSMDATGKSPSLWARDGVGPLSAFAVMSLVNFVVAGIQTWLLVVCCAAMVAADGRGRTDEPDETVGGHSLLLQRLVGLVFIVLVLMLSVITVRMTYAQYRLGRIEERMSAGEAVSDSAFDDIENHIYSSEAFWRLRARNLMRTGDYGQATLCINNAMRYTAAPDLLYMAHQCCMTKRLEKEGIKYINRIYDIQPSLILPKFLLMRYYDNHEDTVSAIKYAKEISSSPLKIHDKDIIRMKIIAKKYLHKHTVSESTHHKLLINQNE